MHICLTSSTEELIHVTP